MYRDLVHLIYPETCLSCEQELSPKEDHLCGLCSNDLILTNFDQFEEPTSLDKLFWGRVELESTYAHFHFQKNNGSQSLLFSLKYQNNPLIGHHFGAEIGQRLKQSKGHNNFDAILPVPLHPKKKFIRGYNQSAAIAKGIHNYTGVRIYENILSRLKHGETQTSKNRFERHANVQGQYALQKFPKEIKHILIVDDVITTGATIETICALIKQQNPDVKISVAALAVA